MESSISTQIKGTRTSHIVQEFFTNSALFPIVNILLEMLVEGVANYAKAPDLYAILLACTVQAMFLGTMQFRGKPSPLLGNLIGPALYSLIEVSIEGAVFFSAPNHIGYWIFAFVIGGLQQARIMLPGRQHSIFILLENLTRTYILFAGYWMFEAKTEATYLNIADFFTNDSHIYVFLAVSLIGLVIGLANVNAEKYLLLLRRTAAELQIYSEWLLGKNLLEQAVANPSAMGLKRQRRAVVFSDIRGFTNWSEATPPEQVVAMLNRYFEKAEDVWRQYPVIKVKLTGDEIMIVLDAPREAVRLAQELQRETGGLLAAQGLSAGIGIHCGALVEGLMGSQNVKGYDVIGDTVNTAKRICDIAAGGEILISADAWESLAGEFASGEPRLANLKGKQESLKIYPLARIPTD